MSKLQRKAYHEAGTAVAAYVLRRRFREITIIQKSVHLGSMSKPVPSLDGIFDRDSKSTNQTEANIILLFAGQIAEKLYTSGYNWEVTRGEDRTAIYLVGPLVFSEDERETYLDGLFINARDLIKLPYHWQAVEVLAHALLKERTIGYRKARQIIADAVENND